MNTSQAPLQLKKAAVIFDIDGTIAFIDHRLGSKKNKEEFYELAKYDSPICGTINILRKYLADPLHTIFFVTSRPEAYREHTLHWIAQNVFQDSLEGLERCKLYMRADGDKRLDAELKKEIYEKLIHPEHMVTFVIEDRKRVVEMWRSLGLLCLQTCEGDY